MPKLSATHVTILILAVLAAIVALAWRGLVSPAAAWSTVAAIVAWLIPSPIQRPPNGGQS
jgi:predicted small integral membrane protein